LFIDELPSWLVSIIFRFGDQGGFGVMGVFDGRLHSMNFAPFAHPKWKLSIGDAIYMYIFLKAFSFVLNFLEVFYKRIFFVCASCFICFGPYDQGNVSFFGHLGWRG
jgi:hypothetical protein